MQTTTLEPVDLKAYHARHRRRKALRACAAVLAEAAGLVLCALAMAGLVYLLLRAADLEMVERERALAERTFGPAIPMVIQP